MPGNDLLSIAWRNIKLIWRLMADPRVKFRYKLIPIGIFLYVVSPLDLSLIASTIMPLCAIPGIAAIDDFAVVHYGTKWFHSLCPPEVIREHARELESPSPKKVGVSSREPNIHLPLYTVFALWTLIGILMLYILTPLLLPWTKGAGLDAAKFWKMSIVLCGLGIGLVVVTLVHTKQLRYLLLFPAVILVWMLANWVVSGNGIPFLFEL